VTIRGTDSIDGSPVKCALCRQERPLRQSHVIPEFMYGPLYDQKHRFYSVSSVASKPNRMFQKGLRERLLCDECEQRLSPHERYAREVLLGNAATQPAPTPTGLMFSNLEYKPLKLFLMSLLWRLAVTSIPQYKGAVLGPHLERLRSLVLTDDPADYLTFPAVVTGLTFDRRYIPDLIVPAFRTRIEGRWVWAFVITGLLFWFFVSNRQPPTNLWRGFLQPSGNFPLHVTDIREVPFLEQWCREISRAETARARSSAANATG
jgi:hypothetical protein